MSVSDEDLERYFDGELDDTARKRVEAALDDDDRAKLEALADVRAALRDTLYAEADGIDLGGAVAEKVAQGGQVVSLARRRRRLMRLASTGTGLLVAAAAAFLFFVKPWVGHAPVNNAELESLDLDGVSAVVLTVDGHKANDSATILLTMEED